MSEQEVFDKVKEILLKYHKSDMKAEDIKRETKILDDLNVNSARLVDIIIDFEDAFDIRVEDSEADKVVTVGNGVDLILSKKK